MVDRSLYKVGLVLSVHDCGGQKSKLRACKVNIGDESNPITVVTAAMNVREGSRLVVAPVGSVILDETGEEVAVKSTTVGGVMSEGMFCDSSMLGWSGGAVGVAAQMPESFEIGSAPPAQKPRLDPSKTEDATAGTFGEGLFERKPTKEEKKRIAEERRNARKAAKEAKNGGGEPQPLSG